MKLNTQTVTLTKLDAKKFSLTSAELDEQIEESLVSLGSGKQKSIEKPPQTRKVN